MKSTSPYTQKNIIVNKLIAAQLVEHRYTRAELALLLRCSESTLKRRLKHPGDLTLDQIRKLSQTLRISPEEFVKTI